jgi:hypothetical protein
MELLKRIKKRIQNQANQITVGVDLSFYQASISSIKLYLDSVMTLLVTSNNVPLTLPPH